MWRDIAPPQEDIQKPVRIVGGIGVKVVVHSAPGRLARLLDEIVKEPAGNQLHF